jgi:quercetin dioxygenase-like cupin family protein
MKLTAAATAVAGLAILPAFADDAAEPMGVTWQELAKTSTNVAGDQIRYPSGTPEIYAEIGSFEPGGRTSLHTHEIPILVYVLEGELELRVDGDDPVRIAQGQAFVDPQDRNVQAFNVADGPTRIVAFAVGAQGVPLSGEPK